MLSIILFIITTGLFSFCATMTFSQLIQEGQIFERFGNWLRKNEDHWWTKPLGLCKFCSCFYINFICMMMLWSIVQIDLTWWNFGIVQFFSYVLSYSGLIGVFTFRVMYYDDDEE